MKAEMRSHFGVSRTKDRGPGDVGRRVCRLPGFWRWWLSLRRWGPWAWPVGPRPRSRVRTRSSRFERQRAGGSTGSMGIWTMRTDGSGQALLLEVGQTTTDPAWSPDMNPAAAGYQGKIAFIADGDVWVAQADGSGPTNLTQSPLQSAAERDPAWSPDLDPATAGYQGRIAFASNRSPCQGCPANEDVYTIAADRWRRAAAHRGTEQRPRAGLVAGRHVDRVLDQPGRSRRYPGGVGLYVMDATGQSETKIPATTADGVGTNATFPNWSPQGTRLAVNGDANHPGIRVVDPASGTIGAAAERLPERFGRRRELPGLVTAGRQDRLHATAAERAHERLRHRGDEHGRQQRGQPDTERRHARRGPRLAAGGGTGGRDCRRPSRASPSPAAAFQKATSFAVSWSSTDSGSPWAASAGGRTTCAPQRDQHERGVRRRMPGG